MPAKTSKTMNISLTPELYRAVKARVESGVYTSASELVREALRLLERTLRHQDRPSSLDMPELATRQWRELRNALVHGEALLAEERAKEMDVLFLAGLLLTRERLAREMPEATESARQKRLAQWLHEKAGAATGNGFGRPVSHDRLRRILGD